MARASSSDDIHGLASCILASGAVTAQAADRSTLTVAITLGMTILVFRTQLNPLFGIAMGAIFGVVAGRGGPAFFELWPERRKPWGASLT